MAPGMRFDVEDFDESELEARRSGAPELSNRRTRDTLPRKQAKRNRTNEVSKRGIHRRRNKRMSW